VVKTEKEDSGMKKRHTEEQIIGILNEAQAGMPVADLLRKHNISQGTFYRWKAKFGGMDVSEAKRLKALEEENTRLKRLVADLSLDNQILKDINSKNW
jgi:putative transposase